MSDPVQAQLVCPASNCSVLLEALSPAGVYGSSKPASVLHLLFLSEPLTTAHSHGNGLAEEGRDLFKSRL